MAILGICVFTVYVAVFYPGYLTADTVYMLYQTNGMSEFSNWHPVFSTTFFGYMYDIFSDTGPIWVLQVLLLISVALMISYRIKNILLSSMCFLFLTAFPPVMTNIGALWKDCFASIWLLFSVFYFIEYRKSKSIFDSLLVFLFSLLAGLTRTDYIAISLPFILFLPIIYLHTNNKVNLVKSKMMINAAIYVLVYIFLLHVINAYLYNRVTKELNPWVTIASWDIAGISYFSGSQEYITSYNCKTSDSLVWGDSSKFVINLPEEEIIHDKDEESNIFKKMWLDSVVSSPQAYLLHRACVAKRFLGFGEVTYPYPPPIASNNIFSEGFKRSPLNLDIYWFFDDSKNQVLYKYWIYLLIALLIVGLKGYLKVLSLVDGAVFLSIMFCAARVLVLPATDFRYGLWIIFGTIILFFLSLDYFTEKMISFRAKIGFLSRN
nr:hypothetical protein [Vibrio mimicus]